MKAKCEIEKRLSTLCKDDDAAEEYVKRSKRYGACESLTREMCVELIDHITVGAKTKTGEREINIYYKFLSDESLDPFRKTK